MRPTLTRRASCEVSRAERNSANGKGRLSAFLSFFSLMDKKDKVYDDIYFDTDEEDEDNEESAGIGLPGAKRQGDRRTIDRRIPTNDELLYDPDLDDKDEAWVIGQIKSKYSLFYCILLHTKRRGAYAYVFVFLCRSGTAGTGQKRSPH